MPQKILIYRGLGRRLLTWIAFTGAVMALLATPASAAVNLQYFQGHTESDRVFLEWKTATELDNAGFLVRRNETGGIDTSNYTPIPVIDATSGTPYNFIPARGDSLLGAYYPFYDENVDIGTRYYYLLQDVDTSNFSSYHGPIEVVAGQTNTPAPSPSSTSPPNSTPTRTATAPSATPGPSATPSATLAPRTATSTAASLASATATSSPTAAGTLDPDVTPLDATLTAIALALTELPTATRTPAPLAQSADPTPIEQVAQNATPLSTADSGLLPASEDGQIGRLVLVILLFLGSGALLTGGIVFLARRSREEA